MSTATVLRDLARPLDTPADLAGSVDELLAARPEPPAVLALGEPAHGIAAFPLLRNEILAPLVERGFRSIALESDYFAASVVNDYVSGSTADLDSVLTTGFSHGFGGIPGNRELVEWLRAHNAERAPADRVHFHGFEAPVEYAAAPGPRRALSAVLDYLPAALRPSSIREVDALVGADADWTNEAAMYDPTASIGSSARARALRVLADDLAGILRRAAPTLRSADPAAHDLALAHARTALGLLRYHAAMASPGPDRIASLLSVRSEMMAENLLAVRAREQRRGPTLVFAHNVHLQRAQPAMQVGDDTVHWPNAGALVELDLGERYLFVATDATLDGEPGTVQGRLAAATTRRALFPAPALRETLPGALPTAEPIARGHIPLTVADMSDADAVILITDTDGRQYRYW
ncbi:erythromycin esterase family protein [Nocardia huaxiensis]|uniref:erythromycin esterase family protein n=1 Tax=Nocardia huaxiensis TaxID=2755382 RepID=UPI001E33D5F6|nr:erythromycin esterase family protein [Nocardia huaxiensis]UFS93515.1 erythromycin esterase family protein [Nocardia huaxiensis]